MVTMLPSEVPGLTDEELRAQLIAMGVDVGPIMDSTRKLYQRKLVRLLAGDDAVTLLESGPLSASPSLDFSPDASPDEASNILVRRQPQVSFEPVQRHGQTPVTPYNVRPVNSPFPAADAQFKKRPCNNSMTDHCLKFASFVIVITIIVFIISNQDTSNAVELKNSI